VGKDTKKFGNKWALSKKNENKWRIIWKINEKCLSLQRQNNSFDYAAECGEQDLIDTTPF
jgi:hypothetical protein